uniref:NDT80 domain-containing protein n=2 Tax=Panagrolaimus sp. JU765 TaxID=591449 RepID=A0AC34Q5D7_9BILA
MAKRQSFVSKEETGFGDPLGEYSEGFNILQFINDNDTPIDSPADLIRNGFNDPSLIPSLVNNNTIEGAWIQSQAPHPAANNNYPILLDNTIMYTNGTRLPDSPPITDISAGGSSASPSTTSDSPFSPEQYYMLQQGNINIVGMPDLNGQVLVPQDLINQQMTGIGRLVQGHPQLSPQSEFLSPYPPQSTPGSQISQVSPPAVNNRFIVPNPQQGGYTNDVYASEASLCSANNVQPPSAKRKRSDMPVPPQPVIKDECPPQFFSNSARGTPSLPVNISMDDYDENYQQRAIRFSPHCTELWTELYDIHHQHLQNMAVTVVADKGFNYSTMDGCFVNQKKNHFQITVHIEVHEDSAPVYFRGDGGVLKKISDFKLAFCGVKAEMPTTEISIRQSQTDRKPVPHEPVSLEIHERRVTKVTVPRLHFSETTLNNHRKNGRPNPEQKFFLLLVKLIAYAPDGSSSLIQAYQSDKVIVRVSLLLLAHFKLIFGLTVLILCFFGLFELPGRKHQNRVDQPTMVDHVHLE